jgi:hypothetical protein
VKSQKTSAKFVQIFVKHVPKNVLKWKQSIAKNAQKHVKNVHEHAGKWFKLKTRNAGRIYLHFF